MRLTEGSRLTDELMMMMMMCLEVPEELGQPSTSVVGEVVEVTLAGRGVRHVNIDD